MQQLSPKQQAFLVAYAEAGNVTLAAQAAEVARTTHYDWLEDEGYAAAFAAAQDEAVERLEAEARKRATVGRSDVLLIFLLKSMRPERYRDNAKIEHTGPGGGPLRTKVDLSNLTDEQLSTLESLARAAAQPGSHRGGEAAQSEAQDGPILSGDGTVPEGAVPEAP